MKLLMATSYNGIIDIETNCPKVRACFTSRHGGFSDKPYDSFNLGLHVGDSPEKVRLNRGKLEEHLGRPVLFMNQTHSDVVVKVDDRLEVSPDSIGIHADGLVTASKETAVAVLTADCLPLLLWSEDGLAAAAVHCGWRGLASGIVSNAVKLMKEWSNAGIRGFIGPCIGPSSFEVGADVLKAFQKILYDVKTEFSPKGNDKYLGSLPDLCIRVLNSLGVSEITCCGIDTYSSNHDFFSYRKEKNTSLTCRSHRFQV